VVNIYFYQRSVLKIQTFVDVDTSYNRVMIYDTKDSKTGKPVKIMRINDERSSAMFLDDDGLVFQYLKYYDLVSYYNPDFRKTLMIGGSAFAYPKHFIKKYPSKEIDVVEIDSQLTELARAHFGLVENPKLGIFHEDARTFFNRNTKKYDAIFIDVFNSQFTLPFQLTTLEFVQHQYNALNENGLVIVNIISSIRHKSNEFLLSEAKTFREVFPKVEYFAVTDPKNDMLVQNIMLIAFRNNQVNTAQMSQDSLFDAFLANKIELNIPGEISLLTDDYAPVEYFVSKMISHYYGVD
jgi:spermidine synthase